MQTHFKGVQEKGMPRNYFKTSRRHPPPLSLSSPKNGRGTRPLPLYLDLLLSQYPPNTTRKKRKSERDSLQDRAVGYRALRCKIRKACVVRVLRRLGRKCKESRLSADKLPRNPGERSRFGEYLSSATLI